jgi:hypothetical protein
MNHKDTSCPQCGKKLVYSRDNSYFSMDFLKFRYILLKEYSMFTLTVNLKAIFEKHY